MMHPLAHDPNSSAPPRPMHPPVVMTPFPQHYPPAPYPAQTPGMATGYPVHPQQVRFLGDAKSFLGDAESSLGDAKMFAG